MEKEVVEQYLKTIFCLGEGKRAVKTNEIAKSLDLAPASVTESLQKLSEDGYLRYRAYRGASLTKKGLVIASNISRKHRLLERFLSDTLRLDSSKVHKQACEMEHALSDEAEVALCRMLNHPGTCPDDGKAIPPCNLDVSSCKECQKIDLSKNKNWNDHSGLKPLTEMRAGEKAKIHFIRGGGQRLSRLNNIGMTKNTEIEMLHAAPMKGPIEICVRGCKFCLGREIASDVFVET